MEFSILEVRSTHPLPPGEAEGLRARLGPEYRVWSAPAPHSCERHGRSVEACIPVCPACDRDTELGYLAAALREEARRGTGARREALVAAAAHLKGAT